MGNNQILEEIEQKLLSNITIPEHKRTMFFKTDIGSYSNHDKFLGINNPTLHKLSKEYKTLPLNQIHTLLCSSFNEKRLLALFILKIQYKKEPNQIYSFYLTNIDQVNNWNLVDASAQYIIGLHILSNPNLSPILQKLASSDNLWHKRISIIATQTLIKINDFNHTLSLATFFLTDSHPLNKHDLIQKATGWMLREIGKQNKIILINFLKQYHTLMPRTMFRYATEKLHKTEYDFNV